MSAAERRDRVAAAVLLVACLLGWVLEPQRFAHAWLAGFVAFSLWPLGSMALVFVHALTGGRWGVALRPGLLAGVGATVLLPVLVIPVLLCLPALYPWARPEGASLPNRFWLNVPFFAARGGVELVVWLGLAALVLRGGRLDRIAPAALMALAVTVTFAAIDLTMSLDPRFASSAYGMIAGAEAVLFALGCAVWSSPAPAAAVADDIGRLLLALCALWTYLDFMQVVIVFQNDLVTQTPWYLARSRGIWGWVMGGVALGHGIVPVLALLSPGLRRSRRGLLAVAGLLMGAVAVRSWWTVLPPLLPPGALPLGLLELCCMALVAAAGVLWTMRRRRYA